MSFLSLLAFACAKVRHGDKATQTLLMSYCRSSPDPYPRANARNVRRPARDGKVGPIVTKSARSRDTIPASIHMMTREEAAALAAALDLELDDVGICLPCLSFVSMAIDSGDERKIAGEITRMGPVPVGGRARATGLHGAPAGAGTRCQKCGRGDRRSRTEGPAKPSGQSGHPAAGSRSVRACESDPLKMGFEPWPPRGMFN
jgi:hypothetical protein